MTPAKPITVNPFQEGAMSQILTREPLLSSYQAGWQGIHLVYYHQPSWEIPEIITSQHIVSIPLTDPGVVEIVAEGKVQTLQKFPAYGTQICPADLPYRMGWSKNVEFIHCYLDPQCFAQNAYETISPERVELIPNFHQPDPLISQMGLALKAALENDPASSHFYAESMSTALSAHLLQYYSTRKPVFQEYGGGLSKYQLRQAVDYIQDRLAENISLEAMASEIGISRFYFCRLFKQSTGITPYQYLIKCRIERSKILLRERKLSITDIALEVGFSNQSHFTKHFKRLIGTTPKIYRDR
ncbi:MAG: AraC family transcriptional regulator [Pleurocapsa sp. MO_226.B13]|nr:AraC family transcriptional regulator [Pleurocapsa sp. MO_226.B13]